MEIEGISEFSVGIEYKFVLEERQSFLESGEKNKKKLTLCF